MSLSFSPADITEIAKLCLGEPNSRHSSKTELRWGTNGGMMVRVDKGTWAVHGSDEHGGMLDLIVHTQHLPSRSDAVDWLKQHGFKIDDDDRRQPQHVNGHTPKAGDKGTMTATFDYVDEIGTLLYQVCRFETDLITKDGKREKTFRQRRPDAGGQDGFTWKVQGTRPVPYLLPDLIEAVANESVVFVAEGEKTVDALRRLGVPATCNSGGAGKWPDQITPHFEGADVVILPDNDEAGQKHRDVVVAKLFGIARSIRVLDLPGLPAKGDAFDWIAAGGDAEQLYALLDTTSYDATEVPFNSRFGGSFAHEAVKSAVTRDWVVKGAILARSFALVIGPPGCGKSFLMLDLAMVTAAAATPGKPKEWFGRKIKPCGVVYVSAEGQDDFVFRIKAWLQSKGSPALKLPLFLIPTSIDLRSDPKTADTLADEIKAVSKICEKDFGVQVGLVFIDTVNRALAGGNENASEVMGAFVINCSKIKEACGVTVIGVHHSPEAKDAGAKARGHGSLHGATDAEISVSAKESNVPNRWRVQRLKAGPTGSFHEFRLASEKLGVDDDGDPVTSCVVMPGGTEPSLEGAYIADAAEEARTGRRNVTADGRVILGGNLTMIMTALVKAIEDETEIPPVATRVPHGRRSTTFKHWTDEIMRIMPGEDKEGTKFRDKCRKARDAAHANLMQRGLIGTDRDFIWRTNRRIASVDRVETSEIDHGVSSSGPEPSEITLEPSEYSLGFLQEGTTS